MSQALSRPLPVVIQVLGLRRNIVVLSLAIFCVGLGEELWARFLPKYTEALGARVAKVEILAKWVLPSRACRYRQRILWLPHHDMRPPSPRCS
jgi:hypothetical protein